jgi:adenylate cyclase
VAALLKNTRESFRLGSAAAALFVAALFLFLGDTRGMRWLENATFDARMQWLDSSFDRDPDAAKVAAGFVVIDIDNATFDQFKPLLGRWPWSRRVWTETARFVNRGRPKVLAMDIIFGGDESAEVDEEFTRVIQRSGKVVLAYSYANPGQVSAEDTGELQKKLALLADESVPYRPGDLGDRIDDEVYTLNTPLEPIGRAAAGLGVITAFSDDDGTLRRVNLQYRLGDRIVPAFALRIAQVASGRPVAAFTQKGLYAVQDGWRVPVDEKGRMVLLWRNGDLYRNGHIPASRLPLGTVICSIYPDQCPADATRITPEFFKDKIVLLGASLAASFDFHNLPLKGKQHAAGFLVHMNAVENLLQGQAVRVAPGWVRPAGVILMSLLGAAILVFIPSASVASLAALALVALYGAGSSLAMVRGYFWMPLAAPLAGFFLSFIAAGLIRYATTGRELRRTRGTLDRYISPQLVNYVLEHPDEFNLKGVRKELTILFSDVRNFTTITEGSDPMELIATLNEYLEQMTDVIFKYDGITDKFIGDGILAYWGAFTPDKNHAVLACQAALEMLERLAAMNEKWKAEGRQQLAIGIGINTGEVVFGNVGAGKKTEFTVIGDAVNLAARLESQTKEFGVKILISEFTVAKAGGMIVAPALGNVKVKGKTVDTLVFELQSMAPDIFAESPPERAAD